MKIPKKIDYLITKRRKLAQSLQQTSNEIESWLEKRGINYFEYPLADVTMSGVMIFFEPKEAESILRTYLNELEDKK